MTYNLFLAEICKIKKVYHKNCGQLLQYCWELLNVAANLKYDNISALIWEEGFTTIYNLYCRKSSKMSKMVKQKTAVSYCSIVENF